MIDRLVFGAPFVYSSKGSSDTSIKSRELRTRIKAQDQGLFHQIAAHVAELYGQGHFPGFFASDVALVPVPGHAPLAPGATTAPSRIAQALLRQGLGGAVTPLLERTRSVTKSAYAKGPDRPRARYHFDSMAIEQSLLRPTRILLIDDFITRGATLIGAASRIQVELPGVEIQGFALVRSITDDEITSIREPCVGTIELDSEGETWRRP